MFAIAIVFAVVIFLVLAIGLIFLSFSDVFLVFSIVAFMVLVVFVVSSVILRKARKTTGNVINYDKNLFDIHDIFVDSTWERQMISEMIYGKVALAYAHPENTKKIFGDRPFDFDRYIHQWHGNKEDLIYLLGEKLNLIQGIPVTDKAFQGLMKRVRIRGTQNVTPELEEYASIVIEAYKKYLEKSKNIELLYSMINIETGELKRLGLRRSNAYYPLTWFYRTPHEKLKTILEKSWSVEERNRQIYIVLYAFISKFVNKKVRTSTGEERFILSLKQNEINLIPPLGDAVTKKDFYEAIQRAYCISHINLNLSLMPTLEDVKKYYRFYERTQQVSMLQVRELIELYTVIARHIYENKEGFLVYDIIMNKGVPDLIYLPLFMFESFPNIINVERGLIVTEREITVVVRNLENVLGMRRKLREDILNRRLLPAILCCVFINLKFKDFMRFMKALFVVLSYIVKKDISNLNIFSELFHYEDRFKKQDIRFRAAIFSYVYFLLFGGGQSLKGFSGNLSTERLEEMKRLSPKSIERIKAPDLTNFNAIAGGAGGDSDFVFTCYRYIFELLLCKNTYHRDMVTGRYLLNTRKFVGQMEEFSSVN